MDAQGGMSLGFAIVWMVVLFGIMYFLMIRPQKKEQKRLQAMLNDMEVGDSVVTTGGFYGVVIDMTEEDVIVEFGNNKNCRIPMRKQAIAEVEKAEQASA
ncbi:MAG: preprotein translocase subunit YajC [Blautia sp.]|nr:preprotein translocase subunit YajC [Eubacteriales bacterium]MED9965341.1 preprotein translocase subunit YajC [Blautia sp.]